jgi:carbamoyl-phosphate synthase large subunit
MNVIEKERPEGIIVQFGGQTPLSIAKPLQEALEKNPIPAASGASVTLVVWSPRQHTVMYHEP